MDSAIAPGIPNATARNCWSSIGVRGDKSCELLANYAHCRNCPTYSRLAATLLNREMVRDGVDEWAAHYAEVQADKNLKDRSTLVFRVGSEWFGIGTHALDEVIELRGIHRLPHRHSPVVMGVTNVRGELVVCVSLNRLLGIGSSTIDEGKARRLLVLRSETGRLAMPVDEVQQTHAHESGEMLAPPANIARSSNSYTVGILPWHDRTVACLDEVRVIDAFERSLA